MCVSLSLQTPGNKTKYLGSSQRLRSFKLSSIVKNSIFFIQWSLSRNLSLSALNTLYTNDALQMEGEGSVCKNYLIYCCCFPIARPSWLQLHQHRQLGRNLRPELHKNLTQSPRSAEPQMSQETFFLKWLQVFFSRWEGLGLMPSLSCLRQGGPSPTFYSALVPAHRPPINSNLLPSITLISHFEKHFRVSQSVIQQFKVYFSFYKNIT